MQGRYPTHVVLLVEGLVGPIQQAEALRWMSTRARALRSEALIDDAVVYQKLRSSGTMAKPRFLSVFETEAPKDALEWLSAPYEHAFLRPLGVARFELLGGLPRASTAAPDGGLMVGLTNCTDPAQEEAFNAWYDRVHAADVIRSPWFWSAQRYRRIEGDLPTYAALYETTLPGSEAFKAYMQWPERVTDMHPQIANVHVWAFDFLGAL